jgi:hypothetical protein
VCDREEATDLNSDDRTLGDAADNNNSDGSAAVFAAAAEAGEETPCESIVAVFDGQNSNFL